jgi:hypothetical protein
MNTPSIHPLLRFASLAACAATLYAQPTVAPSPERVGSTRGQNAGDYNILHSIETGYRFHSVSGNNNYYRSHVNYGNGVRLLGANLLVNSREGHGRFFDEIAINTQGIGNDPYEFFTTRIQHNRMYRYESSWRRNDYFNPGLAGTAGGHLLDTRRTWQDHDFTIFPQSSFRLSYGFSRNEQEGPGLSSIQLFDARGDEFPLFALIDRREREHRIGAELRFFGFRFTVQRGWVNYDEEQPLSLEGPGIGANPTDSTTLAGLQRREPYNGTSPFWRGSLFTERSQWFSVNARFSYAGSRRDFALEESATGTNRLGASVNRQVLVIGSGRRPLSSGAATLSIFPTERVTFTQHVAFHQVNMDGNATYRELNNNLQTLNFLNFQSLGIRTLVSSSDLNVRLTPRIALFGGFHYSSRRVRSGQGFSSFGSVNQSGQEQSNQLRSGLAGIRINAAKVFTLILDGEVGRTNRPFFPISERNYHALSARAQYKTRTLSLAASARTFYNTNSVSLLAHSSRSRTYSADATWSPQSWLALDASYSRLHLDTLTGIAYFATGNLTPDTSLYLSNIHMVNLAVRIPIRSFADLTFGYSRVQDTGDGRAASAVPAPDTRPAGNLEAFRAAQVFPLRYQSPLARLSVRLHDKIRWNFGYQRYSYAEEFSSACRLAPEIGIPPATPQGVRSACPASGDYRAHTGYTSVVWSF